MSGSAQETFLDSLTVVELGSRLAVGLCGGLLQRLGADVFVVETASADYPHRALLGAGKSVVTDGERLRALIDGCDVVIASSDGGAQLPASLHGALQRVPVICDVSAFGSSGPLAGVPYTDEMIQAFAGLMDTTGPADGEPVATEVPIAECTAAVFAAAAVVAAARAYRFTGEPQRAEVALFDTAVTMLATFLPRHFSGEASQRIGNRHPSMSPWNAYPARDGWLLLCSASNDMWGRVCEVVGRPELKEDPLFRTMGGRVAHADEADAAIAPWIAAHDVSECLEAFNKASVPCGPVYELEAVLRDANVRARGAVREIADSARGETLRVPGPLFHGKPARGRAPDAPLVQARDLPKRRSVDVPRRPRAAVLDGVRVLEMGSYTTAPLAARNLGALGAYVVKLEPPAGELSRVSPPYRDGQSYLCTLSNSDKRCVAVDLRTAEGRALFRTLLAKADVFVENMKPGALARFGFDDMRLAADYPRLIYCSISGYGAGSPLADLPAMDTTIQGMSGIMDLTRSGGVGSRAGASTVETPGVPYKTGASISDLLGGQFALLAILAALEYRDRTGRGQLVDLSMQELSVWLTQFEWNARQAPAERGEVRRSDDGYVYVAPDGTRVPVNTVAQVAEHAQVRARELIVQGRAKDGKLWPLLASPIRLFPVGPSVRRALGHVGEDLDEVLNDWGIDRSALAA